MISVISVAKKELENATPRAVLIRVLRQQLLHDAAVDVGEAEVAALEAVGEFLVVEAEEMKDRRLEIVDMDGVFGDVEPEVIGRADGLTGLDTATGHPHAEGLGVMIAATTAAEGGTGFDHGCAPEFTAPDDEGVVEEPALFQIVDQRGTRLIGLAAFPAQAAFDIAMVVPTAVVHTDESHAALEHTPGEEAVAGVGWLARLDTVHVEDMFGLALDVHQLGRAGLHAIGEFVIVDACLDLGVARFAELLPVQFLDERNGFALHDRVDAFGAGHVQNGIALITEEHTLVRGGHKSAAPILRATGATIARREYDEARKIIAFAAEAIGRPCAHGRSPEDRRSGVHENLCGRVIKLRRVHGPDDGHVISDLREVRHELTKFRARFAVLLKLEGRAHERGVALNKCVALILHDFFGDRLAVVLTEDRLGIEEIDMARRTGHE